MSVKYNKYNTGDVVICINTKAKLKLSYLTYGKSYVISNDINNETIVWIINDVGALDYFSKERFISLEEYRSNVISEILE